MPRVKSCVVRRSRHRKLLSLTTGFRGRRSTCFRIAKQAYIKSGLYARRDRKKNRAVCKRFNVSALNFYLRCNFNVTYSGFIAALRRKNILVSVSVLYYLAYTLKHYHLFTVVIASLVKGC
ncbi:50S ribosomal protein L20 [Candidatus Vidania fulgoroideae]|nr:50S ribosomal protein L20 [Candidatus Vidania fulgoroideae]